MLEAVFGGAATNSPSRFGLSVASMCIVPLFTSTFLHVRARTSRSERPCQGRSDIMPQKRCCLRRLESVLPLQAFVERLSWVSGTLVYPPARRHLKRPSDASTLVAAWQGRYIRIRRLSRVHYWLYGVTLNKPRMCTSGGHDAIIIPVAPKPGDMHHIILDDLKPPWGRPTP